MGDNQGDFYLLSASSRQTIDVCIGDVMGKGATAGRLAVACRKLFAQACSSYPPLHEIIDQVQSRASQALQSCEHFVTFCYVRFDLGRGILEFVDAGHTGLVVVSPQGRVHWLKGNNLPLGVVTRERYTVHRACLRPGERYLLFTDGVTEAIGRDGTLVDHEGLSNWLESGGPLLDNIARGLRSCTLRDAITCVEISV